MKVRIYTTNVISRGIFMLRTENPLGRFRGEGSGELVHIIHAIKCVSYAREKHAPYRLHQKNYFLAYKWHEK